jgi:hypothetical protein
VANEISVNLSVRCANGKYQNQFNAAPTVSQTAVGASSGVASVTTTASPLPLGSVTTPGLLTLYNLDTTNAVDYGPDNAGTMLVFGTIKPGEVAHLRLKPGTTMKWVAAAGTVLVQYWLLQS